MLPAVTGFSTPSGAFVAPVIALLGAVLAALLFLRPKAKASYKGWMRKLCAHVNFDRFLLASILKFLYVFCALYAVVTGLVTLFSGGVLLGLVWLVLAPVGLRVVFEQILLLLSIREEAQETNDLLRRMQGLPPKNQPQPMPQPQTRPAPQQARAPQGDPRYPPRPTGFANQPAAGYGGYTAQPRQPQPQPQQQARPADYGMTQRYAPIRRDAYTGYDAQSYPTVPAPVAAPAPVRPTPADGTGRFSALPKRDDPDAKP